jgi:hypothetical protein
MRKMIVSRATAGALDVLCRGKGSPAVSRRTISGSLLATAVVVLGLAGAAPAMASTAPSMTTDGNDVNIAAAGAGSSLDFYWAMNGSGTWNFEQVAPPGSRKKLRSAR